MHSPTIYIIDDDKAIIESLKCLIDNEGFVCKTFNNAYDFLEEFDPTLHSCALLDVRMAYMSGPELQEKLNKMGVKLPLIFISAYNDISLAVRIMKAGAFNFITKPFEHHLLLQNIKNALEIDKCYRNRLNNYIDLKNKIQNLTVRESQVLEGITRGKQNKVLASELNISIRTVELHRRELMKKMNVSSVTELIKLILNNNTLN